MRYQVVRILLHDGKQFNPGEIIDLPETVAQPLVAVNVLVLSKPNDEGKQK